MWLAPPSHHGTTESYLIHVVGPLLHIMAPQSLTTVQLIHVVGPSFTSQEVEGGG